MPGAKGGDESVSGSVARTARRPRGPATSTAPDATGHPGSGAVTGPTRSTSRVAPRAGIGSSTTLTVRPATAATPTASARADGPGSRVPSGMSGPPSTGRARTSSSAADAPERALTIRV